MNSKMDHHSPRRSTDWVHWYMAEQGARIVAHSGNPRDRFHIGKYILQGLKDDPLFIAQIDGATDESETNKSLMERSVRCAIAMKNYGLKTGDVIVVMAPNHIHLAVPVYAAMYLGVAVVAPDKAFTADALSDVFALSEPKLVFCERAEDVHVALRRFNENTKIVLFNDGHHQNLNDFVKEFGDETSVEEFIPSSIDPETTVSFLVSTSGTTGPPKFADLTHKNMMISFPYSWSKFSNFPEPTRMTMVLAYLGWISMINIYIFSSILRITRLQSSLQMTPERGVLLIHTYRPTYLITSARFLNSLIQPEVLNDCDFSCFEVIMTGGSIVSKELIQRVKEISPKTDVYTAYGMTETSILALEPADFPLGTIGRPQGSLHYRLIDIDTQEDITEPHKFGELWVKGPQVFKGYVKNPKATAEALTEDGWLKTGDLLYRDEYWNFFFVERVSLMLRYKNCKFFPLEIEVTIGRHGGVKDVAVIGVPSPDGERPVACVVPRPDCEVNAGEVNQLVQDSLTITKKLDIAVIFLEKLPTTSTGKIDRKKLKDIALRKDKE